ncbi:NAD-dependent protein deacetylase [Tessaracoccus terricola]
MPDAPVPDVGGWFRSAVADVPDAPRVKPWEPLGGFGRTSSDAEVTQALGLLRGRATMVLTGAGMSTGAGLPDYRGRDAKVRNPMTYQEFIGSDFARRRYWARSTVGWMTFGAARPGAAHRLLAELEGQLDVVGVVTQNVDRLHQAAGSRRVVDLHGSLDGAYCLACGHRVHRDELQEAMLALNPELRHRLHELARDSATAPDGDAEVDRTETFEYPACAVCGGILKPDVVFFGENARREVVAEAFAILDDAEVLLVLGSSLTVMSGLRFVRHAARDGVPVVIVNDGRTRGDELATTRVHGRLEVVLARWAELGRPRGGPMLP